MKRPVLLGAIAGMRNSIAGVLATRYVKARWRYIRERDGMRLRSDIWVKAYIRSCAAQGAYAVVVRHGDDDAGAIYIKVTLFEGMARAYGPAPAGLDAAASERKWVDLTSRGPAPERDIDAMLSREAEFDPDVWIIEVEDREGRAFLDGWLDQSDT